MFSLRFLFRFGRITCIYLICIVSLMFKEKRSLLTSIVWSFSYYSYTYRLTYSNIALTLVLLLILRSLCVLTIYDWWGSSYMLTTPDLRHEGFFVFYWEELSLRAIDIRELSNFCWMCDVEFYGNKKVGLRNTTCFYAFNEVSVCACSLLLIFEKIPNDCMFQYKN